MRLHFAAELILELVTQEIKLEKIGAHIAETKARIDFFCDKNISFLFENTLSDYNKIIQKDLKIKTGFSDLPNQNASGKSKDFPKLLAGVPMLNPLQRLALLLLKE